MLSFLHDKRNRVLSGARFLCNKVWEDKLIDEGRGAI